MGKRLIAAVAAVLLLAGLLPACGGGGSATPAVVAGAWGGTLSFGTITGGTHSGTLTLDLAQDGDFAAGVATWTPLGEPVGVTVAVDGAEVTLRLMFLCESLAGGVTLTGTVEEDEMRLADARGIACFGRGPDERVSAGSARLVRESSAAPL